MEAVIRTVLEWVNMPVGYLNYPGAYVSNKSTSNYFEILILLVQFRLLDALINHTLYDLTYSHLPPHLTVCWRFIRFTLLRNHRNPDKIRSGSRTRSILSDKFEPVAGITAVEHRFYRYVSIEITGNSYFISVILLKSLGKHNILSLVTNDQAV